MIDLKEGDSFMNGLLLLGLSALILVVAYLFYGRYLVKTWGIDPKATTPAVAKEDGTDFVPTNKWSVFAHQFSSIAGAGPVTGPVMAMMFGWLPAFLWVIVGGVFFGAVQDFGALYASVKSNGKSMGGIIEEYIGKTGKKLFFLFCWLFTLLVIAAFADMVAGTFNAYMVDANGVIALSDAAKTNGAAGTISLLFIAFAMIFGLLHKHLHLTGWKETVVGLICTVAALAIGMTIPITLGKDGWTYITFVYIFFAAVLPMWLLKQPRDAMTTYMFIGMIAGAVVGLLVAHPAMNLPVFTGFHNDQLGDLFPILFVTVACGAVSGFHSLVSSGTSSKTVSNEKDMLKAFDIGADDYVVKPFSIRVLLKRIEVVLKRKSNENTFMCGQVILYSDRKQVFVGKTEISLTLKEYQLLEYFIMNQNQVLTKEMIMENIWGIDSEFIDSNTISVMISRLKKKLNDSSNVISNVFGMGYRMGD